MSVPNNFPISKLAEIETSIFATIGKLVREKGAINLAQGFPDFSSDPSLIDLVSKYMHQGLNQYSPMEGALVLREKIAHKTKQIYNSYYNPDSEITITAGATEAVYTAITCLIEQGDEVIIFEPSFDSYGPVVKLNHGVPVYISLNSPDFRIDWDLVKNKITEKTKLIILNSPHNPSGSVLTPNDLESLKEIVENTKIKVLSDEVYEHIIFDGTSHLSLCEDEELKTRTFVIGSFGKTFHVTGWRMGYCMAPSELMSAFRKVHQFVTFSAATPMQYAIAEYLDFPNHYLALSSFFEKKRNLFLNKMKHSKFTFFPSKGTYFQLMSFSKISELRDVDFIDWLIKDVGVGAIPLSTFYNNKKDDGIIRFCFAKEDETLTKAAEKLCQI
ncbi:MAG TPA: methionine aminotransferase [Cytophagaceae bacterium]|jgi:methionine aminotransferase